MEVLFNKVWYQCCGSGSVTFWASRIQIRHNFYGSGSFHHQAKKVRKTFIFSVLWLYDFLSEKTDVNVPSKSNRPKTYYFLLASWNLKATVKKSRIMTRKSVVPYLRIRGSGFVLKCHESTTLYNGTVLVHTKRYVGWYGMEPGTRYEHPAKRNVRKSFENYSVNNPKQEPWIHSRVTFRKKVMKQYRKKLRRK